MIHLVTYWVGDKEICDAEYLKLVKKFGQEEADRMVTEMIHPRLEQEEKEAV